MRSPESSGAGESYGDRVDAPRCSTRRDCDGKHTELCSQARRATGKGRTHRRHHDVTAARRIDRGVGAVDQLARLFLEQPQVARARRRPVRRRPCRARSAAARAMPPRLVALGLPPDDRAGGSEPPQLNSSQLRMLYGAVGGIRRRAGASGAVSAEEARLLALALRRRCLRDEPRDVRVRGGSQAQASDSAPTMAPLRSLAASALALT